MSILEKTSMPTSVQSFHMPDDNNYIEQSTDINIANIIKDIGTFSEAELARLKELRLKETEYTEEELNFMYKMHLQTDYRKDNL